MAISKAMRAALKALSYPEPDIRKTTVTLYIVSLLISFFMVGGRKKKA